MTDPETDVDDRPVWCIAATVVSERPYGPGGVERRSGLKLFSPGAKVHVPDGFHGMGYESVTVVGRVRKSSRYSIVHVRTEHLTNWRVELVYSLTARARIGEVRGRPGRGGFGLRDVDTRSTEYRDTLTTIAAQFQHRTDTDRARWPDPADTDTTGDAASHHPIRTVRDWWNRATATIARHRS
jgi:hypothetical protein